MKITITWSRGFLFVFNSAILFIWKHFGGIESAILIGLAGIWTCLDEIKMR